MTEVKDEQPRPQKDLNLDEIVEDLQNEIRERNAETTCSNVDLIVDISPSEYHDISENNTAGVDKAPENNSLPKSRSFILGMKKANLRLSVDDNFPMKLRSNGRSSPSPTSATAPLLRTSTPSVPPTQSLKPPKQEKKSLRPPSLTYESFPVDETLPPPVDSNQVECSNNDTNPIDEEFPPPIDSNQVEFSIGVSSQAGERSPHSTDSNQAECTNNDSNRIDQELLSVLDSNQVECTKNSSNPIDQALIPVIGSNQVECYKNDSNPIGEELAPTICPNQPECLMDDLISLDLPHPPTEEEFLNLQSNELDDYDGDAESTEGTTTQHTPSTPESESKEFKVLVNSFPVLLLNLLIELKEQAGEKRFKQNSLKSSSETHGSVKSFSSTLSVNHLDQSDDLGPIDELIDLRTSENSSDYPSKLDESLQSQTVNHLTYAMMYLDEQKQIKESKPGRINDEIPSLLADVTEVSKLTTNAFSVLLLNLMLKAMMGNEIEEPQIELTTSVEESSGNNLENRVEKLWFNPIPHGRVNSIACRYRKCHSEINIYYDGHKFTPHIKG